MSGARRRAARKRARSRFLSFFGGVLLTLLAVSFVFTDGCMAAPLFDQRAPLNAVGTAARTMAPGLFATEQSANLKPSSAAFQTSATANAPISPEATADTPSYDIKEIITMQVGETGYIVVPPGPEGATASFIWISSDESVVTVSQAGEVQAVGEGCAEISLWQSGETNASAVVAIRVEEKGDEGEVWIPRTGKKYHSDKNCSNMKDPNAVSRSEAERLGYTACKKCYWN